MVGKNLGERVATLEACYAQSIDLFQQIRDHQREQNSQIEKLATWQAQERAILAFIAFILTLFGASILGVFLL